MTTYRESKAGPVTCKKCGIDIGDRHPPAKRCVACAKDQQRFYERRSRERQRAALRQPA